MVSERIDKVIVIAMLLIGIILFAHALVDNRWIPEYVIDIIQLAVLCGYFIIYFHRQRKIDIGTILITVGIIAFAISIMIKYIYPFLS